MPIRLCLFAALLLAAAAHASDAPEGAEAPKAFDAWEAQHEFDCNGPLGAFAPADVREHGGYRYEHTGATVKVRRAGAQPASGRPLRIGVLSAIKDAEADTLALLELFVAEFEKQDVEVIFVGGDTADEPSTLDKVYAHLASLTKRPILAVPGNSERPAAHNHSLMKLRRAGHAHLVNMNVVRRLDGDGFDVVSLGGYFNAQFLHMRGACVYEQKDVDALVTAAGQSDDPVVLLMHGPPKQKGKAAIDFVPDSGNVGDPAITAAIKAAKIPFGVFGHILEAGGTATDLAGKTIKPGVLSPALYLNPGSANPLPWKLTAGGTSYGMAAVLTLEGKKAKYQILRAPKPAPKDD